MKRVFLLLVAICPWLDMQGSEMQVSLPWLKHGRVVYVPSNIGRVGSNAYYFLLNREPAVPLNGSLVGIQALIARQAFDNAEIKEFIEHQLASFSHMILGGGDLIDGSLESSYRWNYENNKPSQPDGRPISKEALLKIQELRAGSRVTIIGETWELQYFVLTISGSVEKWTLRGRSLPFVIDTFTREAVGSAGILPKLIKF